VYPDIVGNPFANKHTKLQIDGKVVKRLYTEGQKAFPDEYSALLAGRGSFVTHCIPNCHDKRSRHSFAWEGPTLIKALRSIKEADLQWLGVIHTHPHTPPIPSPADAAGWHYPTLGFWILSFAGVARDLRLYQMEDGRFWERDYEVL
jgi:proteasome lid subunit RPN8/RPN11